MGAKHQQCDPTHLQAYEAIPFIKNGGASLDANQYLYQTNGIPK